MPNTLAWLETKMKTISPAWSLDDMDPLDREYQEAYWHLSELAGGIYDDNLPEWFTPRSRADLLRWWKIQLNFWRDMPGTEGKRGTAYCVDGLRRAAFGR